MPDKLPKGWVKTTLGEVCSRVDMVRPEDTPNAEFTYFDIGGIDNQHNVIASATTTVGRSAPSRARQAVRKHDILFSTVRTYLKNIACIEQDYPNPVASTGFAVIRTVEGVVPRFAFYQVLSDGFLEPLHLLQSGSSYPAVRARDVFAQPFLLPPHAEQERIAAKLDATLARAERAELATRRAQERLQRYRAAILHSAVTGDITRDWRTARRKNKRTKVQTGEDRVQRLLAARRADWENAELRRLQAAGKEPSGDRWKSRYHEPTSPNVQQLPALPNGWTWTTVDQLASGVPGSIQSGPFGSQLRHSEFVRKGILAIGIDNVLDGQFSLGSEHRITSRKYEQLKKFTAYPFDVVVTVMATVGRVCVLPRNLETAIITKHCYRISSAQNEVNPHFLALSLRADAPTRQHLLGNIRGHTRPGINGQILRSAPTPLPPLSEQTEIVREVARRMSAANRLASKLEQQLARAQRVRQSLLRDAFTGRLVPHNPNDEPASVLLELIHAARESTPQQPRGTLMPKVKSKATRRALIDVLRENKKPMTPEVLFRNSGFEASFNQSDEPQDVVDAFYKELRSLTATPATLAEQRDSKGQVTLKALP